MDKVVPLLIFIRSSSYLCYCIEELPMSLFKVLHIPPHSLTLHVCVLIPTAVEQFTDTQLLELEE